MTTKVFNVGNVRADFFDIEFRVDDVLIDVKNIDIGAGSTKTQVWYWTPQDSGEATLSFIIDPDDEIEEILENNNRHNIAVNVTAPGVKLASPLQQQVLLNTSASTTSWTVSLTNTALIATNASMSTNGITNIATGQSESWYVGATESNFTLDGQDSANITVTLVHPTPPTPGAYRLDLLGIDGSLGNCSPQTHGQFSSIKALSPAVPFHHRKIFTQDLLDSGKAMTALQAFPTPASRSNLSGSRFENLQVICRALRTEHQ